jgi:hypothetical protein
MDISNASQQTDDARLACAMATCVPELAVRSTVAIVGAKAPVVRQIGSGTLLAVADFRFVITAAHVLREATRQEYTLGVSGAASGYFTALAGKWMLSMGSTNDASDDKYDVALYQLDDSQIARLGSAQYVRIADASFERDMSKGYYVVSGHPAMWSTVLDGAEDTMKSKILQYGTHAFSGSSNALDNFDADHHFLLEATHDQVLDHTGAPVTFRTRSGFNARMPDDLPGVSGCSVWKIGDLSTPIDRWSKKTARIVGVETGFYSTRRVIKVSRWNAVTTLLYNAFPAARRAIEIYAN